VGPRHLIRIALGATQLPGPISRKMATFFCIVISLSLTRRRADDD